MLKDRWSGQKVQNQCPSAFNVPVRRVVDEATDLESQSSGWGEGSEMVSRGVGAKEVGEGMEGGTGVVGLRPDL